MGNRPKKNVTIYDIAKAANVSPATVSRVLTGNARVSEEKKKLIMEQIEMYDFKPNALARGLSVNKSFTIGFIVPDIKSQYFSTVYYEFEKYALKNNYTALVANSQSNYERESQLLNMFLEKRVDGIVLMGGRVDTNSCDKKYYEEIEEINKIVPVVITSKNENIKVPTVYLDEEQSIYDLVSHLKSQNCSSVGLLCGYDNINVSFIRRKQFKEACKFYGLEMRPEWIVDGDFSIEGGIKAMTKLSQCLKVPDAVCCINDMVAAGALNYAHTNNIDVPGDILITGIDGSYICEAAYPQITTIQVDYEFFARKVCQMLIDSINQTCSKTEIPSKTKVIVRGSTRRILK